MLYLGLKYLDREAWLRAALQQPTSGTMHCTDGLFNAEKMSRNVLELCASRSVRLGRRFRVKPQAEGSVCVRAGVC